MFLFGYNSLEKKLRKLLQDDSVDSAKIFYNMVEKEMPRLSADELYRLAILIEEQPPRFIMPNYHPHRLLLRVLDRSVQMGSNDAARKRKRFAVRCEGDCVECGMCEDSCEEACAVKLIYEAYNGEKESYCPASMMQKSNCSYDCLTCPMSNWTVVEFV